VAVTGASCPTDVTIPTPVITTGLPSDPAVLVEAAIAQLRCEPKCGLELDRKSGDELNIEYLPWTTYRRTPDEIQFSLVWAQNHGVQRRNTWPRIPVSELYGESYSDSGKPKGEYAFRNGPYNLDRLISS
jgi:hypothetical protein